MNLDNSEVLDISKENIQPLRRGRKAAQLKTALQAQIDPDIHQQLMKQRENYEYTIRMYEGDDPLDPYYNYILWLEQSFPSLGRENNIVLLLEDTLLKFKDCDKYRQDQRLVQLLVKYINLQSNPLELYQIVYNQGLGTMCSLFYKAWAEELEKSNDFKRADQVFQLGLQCKAQPVNELQDAHVQFQLGIARKLLEGNMNPIQTTVTACEPSRSVLSKLQPSKVKSSRTSKDSAGVFASTKNSHDKISNFGAGKFQVYQEDSDDDYLKWRHKNESENLPKGSTSNRENLMCASKWYGQKAKQSSSKRISVSTNPSFDIHEDPNAACDNIKSFFRPCALKTRKEEFRCPVAIFGPPNPNQLPMYPKQLVYVGGRDVQLEEIRAAFYWKKLEKDEQNNSAPEFRVNNDQISSIVLESQMTNNSESSPPTFFSNLSNDEMTKHVDDSEKEFSEYEVNNHAATDAYCHDRLSAKCERYSKLIQPDDLNCDMIITPARPITCFEVYLDEDISSFANSKNECFKHSADIRRPLPVINENAISPQISKNEPPVSRLSIKSMDKDFEFLKPTIPPCKPKIDGNINVFVDHDVLPRSINERKQIDDLDFMLASDSTEATFNKKNDIAAGFENCERENVNWNNSFSSSMTINTKAAMNVIQQMWESPLTLHNSFETMTDKPPIKSNKCLFPVYNEDVDLTSSETKPLSSKRNSFPIFCDDTFSQANGSRSAQVIDSTCSLPYKSKSSAVVSSHITETNTECERKFGTPLPLIVPVKLQDSPVQPENKENRYPAEYFAPDDCKNYDEENDNESQFNSGKKCEIDDETCNTRVFAFTLPSSTPQSRKEKFRTSRLSSHDESCVNRDNDFSICYTKPTAKHCVPLDVSKNFTKSNNTASDLSLIMENSKEHGSSNSSCNSNGSKLLFS